MLENKKIVMLVGPGFEASQILPEEIDAVLIPGGWAPDKLRRDEKILRLVRKVYENSGLIGMICHAGLVGISAGIVKGKRATGSRGIKDDLENAGAVWVDEPAFREGNIVWGTGRKRHSLLLQRVDCRAEG